MNIKLLDSWLREYLKTKATAKNIAEKLSLTSVSVERVDPFGKNDFIYEIEVTTNRPDLMSVIGLAREAAAILPQFDIEAKFVSQVLPEPKEKATEKLTIDIENDPSLVNRICAVVMEVKQKESPLVIRERLESSGIRSLNNIVDVTNYIMRETGHPAHVFDYDRLYTKKLIIRESKKGEKFVTLDLKEYESRGEDIVADNGKGEIVDLMGVMGTANSVVTDKTKRILLFLDNVEPTHIRRTSMKYAIRTEAAVLNEKGIDPQITYDAFLRGIELYKEYADGKIMSDIADIYPNKVKAKKISISDAKINKVIGVEIRSNEITSLLSKLGLTAKRVGDKIEVSIPPFRQNDISIEEDIIEEIARVYGYHRIPSILPPLLVSDDYNIANDPFYWEKRIKQTLKHWGFTEIYTYSLVSEDLLEGPSTEAMALANPLTEDMVYLRKTLVPSLLSAARANERYEEIRIFELANVYIPKKNDLPTEIPMLAGVVKRQNLSFFEIKGIIEELMYDLGIKKLEFKKRESGGYGAQIYIEKDYLGEIEVLDDVIADFELNFEIIKKYANLKKTYREIAKFPPIIEDVRIIVGSKITFQEIISLIKKQSSLITEVSLLDVYENKKTFRIKYLHPEKTLTNEEVSKIREKVYSVLEKELKAKIT